jgi:hypothetical protein
LHEFDRTDALRERKIPIDRMFARDDGSVAAKPGQRDVRPKRPLVRLPERKKKLGAQSCEVGPGRAFRPQKARASRLRTVPDMPEFQGKNAEPVGHPTKLADCLRDRNLIPWRHQREMNVGGSNEPNRKSLQLPRDLRELAGDLRRHLERDENAGRPRTAGTCRGGVDSARSAF